MNWNWTFGRKLALGFAISAIALVVVSVIGYRSTGRLIDNNKWVEHTHEVRRNLASLLTGLVDAETAQRGYLISNNEAYLEPYTRALPVIERTFGELRRLTSDNQNQQRRLEALRPLIDSRLTAMKEVIAKRRVAGSSVDTTEIGEGKRLMDSLRVAITEIDDEEASLLAKRAQEADAAAEITKSVIAWGCVLGLLFVTAVAWFIAQSLTQQVGSAVKHIQSSSTELQAAANQQATGAREQATAMNEISTTISELMATSRQIAESASRVSQIAEKTAAAAKAGDTTVDKGRDSVGGIRVQVDLIVNHMVELGKKSQQIGSVLDIVSELAEQTNILAINATIEAAGAGDAGKRFAVVADEIRKLADRVTGSTKEIRGLIDDVRSAVNTTVMTTEIGSKAVEAGIRQFADVTQAFRLISSQVLTATEAAKEIGLSTKQQSTAVEQVNVAIANVAQATKETEVSTGQTLQTASELSSLSRDLMRIVQPDAANRG